VSAHGESGVILAVDVGGTGLAGGLVDPTGSILSSQVVATDRLGRGEGVLKNLLELVANLTEAARAVRLQAWGVGVGVPGVVEEETGRIGPDIQNLLEFANLPLRAVLEERTGLPVVVDNDVNALSLAEWTFGQAQGLRNLALVAVGTGVGGGLILHGSLVRGASGYGGEIGHITVEMDGRPCFCGSRGCVKTYASGPDMVAQVRELLEESPTIIWNELTGGDLTRINPPLVFRAADRGDPVAEGVVAKASQALGAAVAALINLCNPEMIILGGGVMEAGEVLMEPVRRWARFYAFERAYARTRIVRSGLSKPSGILGAAALFLYGKGRRLTAVRWPLKRIRGAGTP
jgi:glucokinase